MTREELLIFICPMIEVDGCGKEDGCCETCNQYLSILLDEYDKEIYSNAIDDFLVVLKNRIVPGPYDYIEKKGFEIMAEQLKTNLGNKEERK